MVAVAWALFGVILVGMAGFFFDARSERRSLGAKIDNLDAKFTGEFAQVRSEIRGLDAKFTGEFDNLDAKFTGEFAHVRSDITHLAESVGHIQGTLDEHLRRHDTHAVGT